MLSLGMARGRHREHRSSQMPRGWLSLRQTRWPAPGDTVAARARRLGPQLGLRDRAARGQISVITRELRAAA
ncbi:hypothetical protein SAMN05216489_01865 [Streptomyces sp. 3213]|nr:hypothetical protein SAMN05216489_01865 [Streptomyces sp. 3213] [Streptomyces sp. 3213.3]